MHKLKEMAIEVFGEAQFDLHKWHSNEPELEVTGEPEDGNKVILRNSLESNPEKPRCWGSHWVKPKIQLLRGPQK